MKQQSKLLLSLLHGVGVGAVAMSGTALVSTDAVAGISNTLHNLGAGTTNNRVTGGATTEICVFCHTPHGADISTSAAGIPLWNKTVPTGAGYSTYSSFGSSSLDAAGNNGSVATGSISLACLSCHDGTQAMDNIINAPGTQGLDTTGGGTNGRTGGTWAWSGPRVSAEGVMSGGAANAALITGDLRNDHPIGIQYCGGFSAAPTNNSTAGCRDGDFQPIRLASGTIGNSDAQYYVESTTAGAPVRDKSDMMLYTRSFGGTFRPSVECGSCHDPHVETKATNQTAFLRVSQANSGVCLACHVK